MKSLAGSYEEIQDNQEKEVIYTNDEWERRSKLDICKDPIFKYVFSRQLDETLHHAVYLIETILGISIHSITQMDRDSYNIHPAVRQVRFDSAFLVNGKTHVIVEMQRKHAVNDNQRFSRYANIASMYSLGLGKVKNPYREGSVFLITILGYGIGVQDDTDRRNWLYRRYATGEKYCADEIIVPIELVGLQPLLKKDVEELSDMECLKLWLAYSHKKEYGAVMKRIYEKKEEIKSMEKTVQQVMSNEDFFFDMLDMVDEYCRKEAELIYKEMYEEEKKIREEEQRERKEEEKKLKEKEIRLRMKATELAIKLGATQEDIDAIMNADNFEKEESEK